MLIKHKTKNMNKKILKGLGVTITLLLPLVALAQVPEALPSTCCELQHAILPDCGAAGSFEVDPQIAVGSDCYYKGIAHTVAAGEPNPDWGGCCTMDTVYTVTDWIFWIFLAFVIIMGIVTGFMFMTAGGDPGKIEKARGMIVYLVIGIVVAVIVKVIPALARSIVGL